MKRYSHNKMLVTLLLVLANSLALSPVVKADDTEIFFNSPASTSSSGRPKVMIVFDDSGSMDSLVTTRPNYDPLKTDYAGGVSSGNLDRIYWSTTGEPPPAGSNQWFEGSQNRCASSFDSLSNQGFFSTKAARWSASGTATTCVPDSCPSGYSPFGGICLRWFPFSIISRPQTCTTETVPGEWLSLSGGVHAPPHVDCEEDVDSSTPGNGPAVADGYPKDDVTDPDVYSAAVPADSDVDWGTTAYTLYTGNYVDYWNDSTIITTDSRINIAKNVISNLVTANTGLDFGLATFNNNNGDGPTNHNGGRVINRIIDDMTPAERASLVGLVNSTTAGGWTPLCESYYEVYRYITGSSVLYADQRDTGGTPDRDLPVEDPLAEDGSGNYIAPTFDCGPIYVILMTDGLPTYDHAANAAIETLTGQTCDDWEDDFGGESKNCLPELSKYLSTTDLDGDASNGDQYAVTYTIGFDIEQPLLEAAATFEDGYFEADSAETLTSAFNQIVSNILTIESTFTSPAVAVDTFTRTQSRDDVFYAMFKPDNRVDWRGNVKKLKLKIVNGKVILVDKNDVPAINPLTGYILEGADTYWSSNDGGAVEAGGVGELLAERDPATRIVKSNTGSGGSLEDLNATNMTYDVFPGYSSTSDLYTLFGVPDQPALETVLDWALGYEISASGASTGSPREWIMGDPLHSQPLIINYGALGSFTLTDPDLRIVVGTNSGFLHMFGSDDGQEDWAFFPKELAPILNPRRVNNLSPQHIYGVDLTPSLYTKDVDADGTLDASDGDKAWIYVGLRRGGRVLYALDVSSPNSPVYKWEASPLDAGMSELGQTWSEPVITRIPGYVDGSGVPKPVVIVGAGYDTNKDSSGVGTADSRGRGVFILDADTGALVRSITPATRTDDNLSAPGLTDSVPGQVAIVDSNADELTDRLYFTDTGGNVWRVDINIGLPDFDDGESWYVTKLASLGHASSTSQDRRFFNKPDVVRTRDVFGDAVDVLLIGSGDRTNPLADDVNNFFYLLRDRRVIPYTTTRPTPSECTGPDPVYDFRCSLPIDQSSLYNITNSLLLGGTEAQQATERGLLDAAAGWKYPLSGSGEKSLSDSITIQGQVLFTTYTPPGIVTGTSACEPNLGEAFMYLVDIDDGETIKVPLGPIIPDTPSVVIPGPGEPPVVIPPPGAPPGDPNDPEDGCIDGSCFNGRFDRLRGPHANFWYREDY